LTWLINLRYAGRGPGLSNLAGDKLGGRGGRSTAARCEWNAGMPAGLRSGGAAVRTGFQ